MVALLAVRVSSLEVVVLVAELPCCGPRVVWAPWVTCASVPAPVARASADEAAGGKHETKTDSRTPICATVAMSVRRAAPESNRHGVGRGCTTKGLTRFTQRLQIERDQEAEAILLEALRKDKKALPDYLRSSG